MTEQFYSEHVISSNRQVGRTHLVGSRSLYSGRGRMYTPGLRIDSGRISEHCDKESLYFLVSKISISRCAGRGICTHLGPLFSESRLGAAARWFGIVTSPLSVEREEEVYAP